MPATHSAPAAATASVTLPTVAPFHLEATVRVLQRRPANPVEVWEDGRYLRAFATSDGPAVVAAANRGSIDVPDVRLTFVAGNPSVETRRRLTDTIRRVLGLDVDPAPLQRAAAREPRLERTARALRGMRPPRFATLFDTFANVVPFQQLSLDAGLAIVTRFVERFGGHVEHGGRRLATYPAASAVARARLPALLACGLSRSKAEALRNLARAVDAGELDERSIADSETREALEKLVALPGIGPWSAALVLLRGFGRLDVFPPGDSGAKRALETLLELRSAEALDRAVERFAEEHRGYLYLCALGGSLLRKGLIRPAP
jgi:DNA-3-methyladenine glycosylase II